MKKLFALLLVLAMAIPLAVPAAERPFYKASPTYYCENTTDGEGLTDDMFFEFPGGGMTAEPTDGIIMIGGTCIAIGKALLMPMGQGNTYYVPVRFAAEALGGRVDWDGDKREVTINFGGSEIILTIGSDRGLVDGREKAIGWTDPNNLQWYASPPVIINDRTYLPASFVADYLGADVEFCAEIAPRTVVAIDAAARNTDDDAELADYVKAELLAALETSFKTNAGGELEEDLKAALPQIHADIDSMEYSFSISRYAVFSGLPFLALVDFEDKSIFFYQRGNGFATISRIDPDAPELFYNGYITD